MFDSRLSEFDCRRRQGKIQRPVKQALLERSQETLAEIDQFNKEFKKDTDLIKDLMSAEAKRRMAQAKWMIAAPAIVFLLFLAWRWLTQP